VRTRTLLLLAIVCGLAILVAGVVQLLRVAGQEDPPVAATVGEPVRVGDLTVTVVDYSEAGATAEVTIETSGVDDPDGTQGFVLVTPGEAFEASGGDDPPACAGTTVAAQRCILTYGLGDGATGTSRVLIYRRGDEQARWELALP
jgi:hypothetical protein